MSLFARAFDNGWLSGMVQAAAGGTVMYRRGATSVGITAVVGQELATSNAEGGPRTQWSDRDYILTRADMEAAGLGQPRLGDQITDAEGTFELQEPDTGQSAWVWAGPDRVEFRLHMKRV